jgi:hypothetical protein
MEKIKIKYKKETDTKVKGARLWKCQTGSREREAAGST